METNELDLKIADLQKKIIEDKSALVALKKQKQPRVIADYTLIRSSGDPVQLSDLFAGKSDLIVIHNMGSSCPYCTLWADGINGVADHLMDRAAVVLVSPDEPHIQQEFAQTRGWRFPVASAAGTTFIKDMGFEFDGDAQPGFSTLKKLADGTIQLIAQDVYGPGDDYCLVWPTLDLLADGSNDWSPKYSYAN